MEARAYAERARADGVRNADIADALGVDHGTVSWWLRHPPKGKPTAKLARIDVVGTPSTVAKRATSATLVLELNAGMRLTGLDVASAAALLRLLS